MDETREEIKMNRTMRKKKANNVESKYVKKIRE
jgi:hypothetical protein